MNMNGNNNNNNILILLLLHHNSFINYHQIYHHLIYNLNQTSKINLNIHFVNYQQVKVKNNKKMNNLDILINHIINNILNIHKIILIYKNILNHIHHLGLDHLIHNFIIHLLHMICHNIKIHYLKNYNLKLLNQYNIKKFLLFNAIVKKVNVSNYIVNVLQIIGLLFYIIFQVCS